MGDCPICCLPLPLYMSKTTMMGCCSKVICKGCICATAIREKEMRLEHKCPFCREPAPSTDEEDERRRMKRIEANDPVAMCHEGTIQYEKGDYRNAFEYYAKAAALGNTHAHYRLSIAYHDCEGVEKDERKRIYHLEKAAIAGHPLARYELGAYEWNNNHNDDRAVKHWVISATQGEDDSIKALMKAYKMGSVCKEDLAAALRAQKAAVDATKSPQREKVEGL